MEKSKKEYIAVPTSEHEPAPAYSEEPQVDVNKRARRFRHFLLGGAIALFGLSFLGMSCMDDYDVFDNNNYRVANVLEYPHEVSNAPEAMEFNEYMEHLNAMFGRHPCSERMHRFKDDKPHHGKHHKDHKEHKHHKHHKDHKDHKDHKHKHHKHPDHGDGRHPPPPPPPEHEFVKGMEVDRPHGPHGPHGHPREPFCKINELNSTSTVFNFSPEEFQKTAVFLDGWFSRGGHVRLSKNPDTSIKDVAVNVTLYTGQDKLAKEVVLAAFDHEGQYGVEVKREGHHHRRHEKPKQKDCLVYNIDVQFPAHVDYFENVDLHVKSAQRIEGGAGLENIEFGSVRAGLGHGAIIFDGLKAKKIELGVLSGVVMGKYQPSERFAAASLHGATKVKLLPTGENINISASTIDGPSSVDLPADSFAGNFFVSTVFGGSPSILAPNPEDIHVTKIRPVFKKGYYKEENTGSSIYVGSKRGSSKLVFN